MCPGGVLGHLCVAVSTCWCVDVLLRVCQGTDVLHFHCIDISNRILCMMLKALVLSLRCECVPSYILF